MRDFLTAVDKIREKYSDPEKSKDGQFFIPDEAQPKFKAEVDVLQKEKVEVKIHHVSEEVFTGGNLNSQQMYLLDWMVKKEE